MLSLYVEILPKKMVCYSMQKIILKVVQVWNGRKWLKGLYTYIKLFLLWHSSSCDVSVMEVVFWLYK